MPGIASAATAVLIGHVAGGTSRSGSAPAASCCPTTRRCRSPSSSARWRAVSRPHRAGPGPRARHRSGRRRCALRRTLQSNPDDFPDDVLELMALLPRAGAGPAGPGRPRRRARRADLDPRLEHVRRAGGRRLGPAVRVRVAFRAGDAVRARCEIYRERFTPSAQLARPYVMLGVNVVAADTDDEARLLAVVGPAVVRQPARRPADPAAAAVGRVGARSGGARGSARIARACSFVGSPATIAAQMREFVARTGADELIVAFAHLRPRGAAALVRVCGVRRPVGRTFTSARRPGRGRPEDPPYETYLGAAAGAPGASPDGRRRPWPRSAQPVVHHAGSSKARLRTARWR